MRIKGAQRELIECGDEDHRGHLLHVQNFEHSKTVQFRHLHIQKDQIGTLRLDGGHGFPAVGTLPHHLDVVFTPEQRANPLPCQGLIVDDQCPDLSHACFGKGATDG